MPPWRRAPGSCFFPTPPTARTGHPTWGLPSCLRPGRTLALALLLECPKCCLECMSAATPWTAAAAVPMEEASTRRKARLAVPSAYFHEAGFIEGGRRQPCRPDISSSASEHGTGSWGMTGSSSTRCSTKPAVSRGLAFQCGKWGNSTPGRTRNSVMLKTVN